jgi:hypothetical protein
VIFVLPMRAAGQCANTIYHPRTQPRYDNRALALRGARIGAVLAEQQVHRLLGDAVD